MLHVAYFLSYSLLTSVDQSGEHEYY